MDPVYGQTGARPQLLHRIGRRLLVGGANASSRAVTPGRPVPEPEVDRLHVVSVPYRAGTDACADAPLGSSDLSRLVPSLGLTLPSNIIKRQPAFPAPTTQLASGAASLEQCCATWLSFGSFALSDHLPRQ
jgi:hypothetical protein